MVVAAMQRRWVTCGRKGSMRSDSSNSCNISPGSHISNHQESVCVAYVKIVITSQQQEQQRESFIDTLLLRCLQMTPRFRERQTRGDWCGVGRVYSPLMVNLLAPHGVFDISGLEYVVETQQAVVAKAVHDSRIIIMRNA